MGIAKTLGRLGLWILGLPLALVVVLYLVLLAINWHDQPPSAAALKLQQISDARPKIRDEENAYIYLLGFSIAQEEDPWVWGKKRLAWAQKMTTQSHIDENTDWDFTGENFANLSGGKPSINQLLEGCKTMDVQCQALFQENEPEITHWVMSNKWLLERYLILLSLNEWQEAIPFDLRMPFPPYLQALQAQKLLLANTWLAARHTNTSAVKAMLEQDIRFWRRLQASSDVLISRMIAIAAIQRHFDWSQAILRQFPPEKMIEAIPDNWHSPISRTERSMLRTWVGEWQFVNRITQQTLDELGFPIDFEQDHSLLEKSLWFLGKPLLQPQDSSNRYADLLLESDRLFQVPYPQIPQAAEQARNLWNEHHGSTFPHRAYNILGDMLLATEGADLTDYCLRVTDLEGIRRLTLASIDLYARSVPPDQVVTALKKSPYKDPYTGKPFSWNKANQSLVFQGLAKGEHGKHQFRY